jgi:putative tRNA adenosine deaminase-associated protein
VSYFAAAVARNADGWSASEVSLADAADVEDVADRLRDADPSADVSLLFVESDDAYLVILRLDQGEDLRVFGSDVVFAEESRIGALLLGDVAQPVIELEAVELAVAEPSESPDESEEPSESPPPADADPAGDADLLADLGVPASRLLELCSQEGMLPSDITAEVCQAIGCGDEVEELRVA